MYDANHEIYNFDEYKKQKRKSKDIALEDVIENEHAKADSIYNLLSFLHNFGLV